MRKLCILALLFSSFTAQAGLLDKFQGMTQETIKPLYTYSVEASGWNLRIYEWEMKSDHTHTCVYAVSESGGSSLQCVQR